MTLRFLPILALVFASPALGEDEYEWGSTLLHSDLPLYDFEWEDFWPRSFHDGEGKTYSFGCANRVAFGDWKFSPNPDDEFSGQSWYRFENYGVFHCAANIRTADEQEDLKNGEFSRGFFARIGRASKGDREVELWVLQQGMIPGSDYLLLARPAKGDGIVQEFSVLQTRCPKSMLRRSRNLDVWITRYCAINDRAEMLRFAKLMLREPELGSLKLVPKEEGPETEASDPLVNSTED